MEAEAFEAIADDTAELLVLMRAFYAGEGYPFDERRTERVLRAMLANPLFGAVWVFRLEKRAVGYLVVTHGYSLEFGGRDAFVDELYVIPEMRGRGLGTQALRIAEEHCRRAGISALHLEVERENPGARALYERSGYKAHDRYLMTRWF
ncbi:MAG TPA: GNAT family N-acetyltransferase [Thermoanaerobaculia bacterium]|jgi:ribosomal protein S18 acetylase RimI-like enzyme|nr:GNAT family N-acetyltransferase [Thermoanaerobaculia bacterium]